MGSDIMNIALLTSSRADYGLYMPLIRKLYNESCFNTEIIAFGTHLSHKHGYTIDNIINDGFVVNYRIDTVPEGDAPSDISLSMAKTIEKFTYLWKNNIFDLIISLGDRYEMFAAVASSLPFNIKIAHIHGGETTTGAIDNAFRHSITHMADIHFTAAEEYRKRVTELKGNDNNIYNTGALSIDNLKNTRLLSIDEFKTKFNIDLSTPSILVTFHPETVDYKNNLHNTDELISALKELKKYQIIITMPNSDTMGNVIREKLNSFIIENKNVTGVESFGMPGYLSCMKHCSFMLGNTSSGFIEASFFPKFVINTGNRQNGRILTPNIIQTKINKEEILNAVSKIESKSLPESISIYGDGHASENIVRILKKIL